MNKNGFSLPELLVILAIISILAMVAAPSIQHQLSMQRLVRALDSVSSQFQRARSIAIHSNSNMVVSFATNNSWCLAIARQACDCAQQGNCTSPLALPAVTSLSHPEVAVIKNTFNPASHLTFNGRSGMPSGQAGTLTMQAGSLQGRVIVSSLGRVRTCLVNQQFGPYRSC